MDKWLVQEVQSHYGFLVLNTSKSCSKHVEIKFNKTILCSLVLLFNLLLKWTLHL